MRSESEIETWRAFRGCHFTDAIACKSYPCPAVHHTHAEQIKRVLKQAGFTLACLSAFSSAKYGSRSPYFIPPTFLYKLRMGVTPHVCQVVALSEITNYRFTDWMAGFGFDLAHIPRLQMTLHQERTVLVTPVETGMNERHAWVNTPYSSAKTRIAHEPVATEARGSNGPYLYVKIGNADALTFPELLPGSIVRVDTTQDDRVVAAGADANRGPICLVEFLSGLICCHVKRYDDQHILLLSDRFPQATMPLCLGKEARILGIVDGELRPLGSLRHPISAGWIGTEKHCLRPYAQSAPRLPDLLRTSRERVGLTFRSAHEISLKVAKDMNNKHYAIALGMLSDYETMNRPPRHIAKIMTLCILYGIDFRQYLSCAGIDYNDSCKRWLPILVSNNCERMSMPGPYCKESRTAPFIDFPPSLIQAQGRLLKQLSHPKGHGMEGQPASPRAVELDVRFWEISTNPSTNNRDAGAGERQRAYTVCYGTPQCQRSFCILDRPLPSDVSLCSSPARKSICNESALPDPPLAVLRKVN